MYVWVQQRGDSYGDSLAREVDGFDVCDSGNDREEGGLSLTAYTNSLRNLESLVSEKCKSPTDCDIP